MKKKKFGVSDILLLVLFVIISIISIVTFKLISIIIIPILFALLFLYYNIDTVIAKVKKRGMSVPLVEGENSDEPLTTNEELRELIVDSEEEILEEPKEVSKVKKVNNHKKQKITTSKSKNKGKIRFWGVIGRGAIICCMALIMLGGAFAVYIIASAGKFDPEALANKDQTVVYDAGNEVIATLGREKRETVTYDQLPQVLVDAIIATEDSRFFQHNGVDMARFMKASFGQILGHSDAGGASTLTMQVVKNNLTSTEKSIVRKFKDIYLAVFKLEKKYSKEEILEFYVNDSLLGGNVYGVEQASQYYFGKSVSELSLPEAAIIAGLFQSPNGYNPYLHPDNAAKRRETVLNLMVRHGYITKEEADIAGSIDVESLLVGNVEENNYQGYIDTVVEEITKKTGDDPYLVPMKIYTTMDKSIQDGLNKVLSGEAHTWEDDYIQAGITVVNVENGSISAIGAGRNRQDERTWNYATQEIRHPGSTAKPIFDYGPGFEYNNFSTYTLFNDEPWSYTNGQSINNWDGSYHGLITLKQALSVSRNIPALKAFQQVDKRNIIKFVESLGITPEKNGNSIHEAHSIGAFEKGTTSLEMAAAYAAFASGGYYTEPYTVTKIEYRSTGETKEFKVNKERVMSDSTAYLMNYVLKYAVDYGFNGGAKVAGSTVAAKTGTSTYDENTLKQYGLPSSAVHDLWTVAYTPEYSISLWYGYQNTSSEHYLTGASAPKDAVMKSIMQFIPKCSKQFTKPDSVVEAQVEKGSWPAKLPSEYTPSDLITTEVFKKGTEPTEVSERFSKLEDVTNLKAVTSGNTVRLTWNGKTPEVITDDYLNKYFSQSVFGNGTSGFVSQRKAYNDSTLGGFGYGIYVKSSSGTTTQVGFTKGTSFTYNAPSSVGKNITITIKAQYQNFTANASNGVNVKATLNGSVDNPSNDPTTDNDLVINLGKIGSTPITVGSYKDPVKILYNDKDITNSRDLTTSFAVATKEGTNLTTTPLETISELDGFINSQEAGTYIITYKASYKGQTTKQTRSVTLKEQD